MKLDFKRLMDEASRLTHRGDLKAATASIAAALRRDLSVMTGGRVQTEGDVIDVEPPKPAPRAARSNPASAGAPGGSFTAGHFAGPAGARDFKLFVPPGASDDEPLPLVVMLHGCTQDPDDFAAGTQMNAAALAQRCIVLYPAQTAHANSSRCWNWFKHNHQARERGEPAIVAGMVSQVMSTHPIDPQRIYVAGLSAGGAMAAIVAAAYPEIFAAAGVHSGLAIGAATDMSGAFMAMKNGAAAGTRAASGMPPTIVFHGDQDTTVGAINGEQLFAAAAAGAASVEESGTAAGRRYTRRIAGDAKGRSRAEHWLVHGAGHAWSGGSTKGSYADAAGPDATAEMLRFFMAHPLAPVRKG